MEGWVVLIARCRNADAADFIRRFHTDTGPVFVEDVLPHQKDAFHAMEEVPLPESVERQDEAGLVAFWTGNSCFQTEGDIRDLLANLEIAGVAEAVVAVQEDEYELVARLRDGVVRRVPTAELKMAGIDFYAEEPELSEQLLRLLTPIK